jgi:ParB family chromosome partitioning protein
MANPKPRLGRGLSALMNSSSPRPSKPQETASASEATSDPNSQDQTATSNTSHGPTEIPLDLIDDNPHQPRENIDPAGLAELTASIKVSGILQPVLLRPVANRYQLVAGHRRTAAARAAGLTKIPAIVRSDTTEETQAEWAIIENIQRQDLNPLERAKAYKTYLERFNLTHAQAAQRLGEERTNVSNYLRLLDLQKEVQTFVATGQISFGHAKILAGIDDSERQNSLAKTIVEQGLSVRKLEDLVTEPPTDVIGSISVAAHDRTVKSAHIVEMEQELSRKLGTKLRIFPARRKGAGKIVIQYFNLDEFDRIVGKIT